MQKSERAVFIVDGARTPFMKATGKQNPLSATDLAVATLKPLLARQPFLPSDIHEVVAGCVAPAADEANIARLIALRSGCGNEVPAYTVQRNCASGLQAVDSAFLDIALGRCDLVLAGGTECMSRIPWFLQPDFVDWLILLRTQKDFLQKLKTFLKFRPYFLKPVIGLLKGLSDPVVNLSMGQTAEILAYEFGISRQAADSYALRSHIRASDAQTNGLRNDITPLYDTKGNVLEWDNGVRKDATLQKLATLKPAFDKPFGEVTAGNSSPVSDGAAFLILASEAAVSKYHLPVLGKIVDSAWSALDPARMGLGPVFAINTLLAKQRLKPSNIDYWEINEAFAAQVLACLQAISSADFGKTRLGLTGPLGEIPEEKLNIDGGAIALGHPVGASGARLVLHMLHILKRTKAKRGVVSLCIGGGQGGAMLLENDEK